MKNILVLSKRQFAELPADPDGVALRIVNPDGDGHAPVSHYGEDLQLCFSDVEEPIGRMEPISFQQAYAIVAFLDINKNKNRFVFHCEHGQSRSHTCALFFAQEILQDEALASLLASAQGKSINFAVWRALKSAHDSLRIRKAGSVLERFEGGSAMRGIIIDAAAFSAYMPHAIAHLDRVIMRDSAIIACVEEDVHGYGWLDIENDSAALETMQSRMAETMEFEIHYDAGAWEEPRMLHVRPKKFYEMINEKYQKKGRRR